MVPDHDNVQRALLDEEYDALNSEADALDEMIAEATAHNPEFPALMEEARCRSDLIDALVALRREARLTQRGLALRMATSQAAVARMEAGDVDPRLSTIQRYAASMGKRVVWQIVDA
jgi:DNA-binding XRE family transcriptional regulator